MTCTIHGRVIDTLPAAFFAALAPLGLREKIDVVDDEVYAARDLGYTHDRYGAVANPDAPAPVRARMAVLAGLMLQRDEQWPSWWRKVGEEPAWRLGA